MGSGRRDVRRLRSSTLPPCSRHRKAVGEGVGCGVFVVLSRVIVLAGKLAAVTDFSVGVMLLAGNRVSVGVAETTVGSRKDAAPLGAFIERQLLSNSTHNKAIREIRKIWRIWRVAGCTVGYK